MDYQISEEIVQKNIESDLKYIKEDMIAHQANGCYCKISRILKCVTVENMTKESYLKYWFRQYKSPKEVNERKRIKEVIDNKFKSGILSLEEAIEIENKSRDTLKEKQRIIKVISDKNTPIKDSKNNKDNIDEEGEGENDEDE